MANICMDTVVFYAVSDRQKSGLAALRQAVNACYPIGTSVDDSRLCRIFELNGIPTNNLNLRSNIINTSFVEDDHITLYCDSAWNPMYEAYSRLADYFGVSFELQAEESGCGVYINTDISGNYLSIHYKAYLSERAEDNSLDALFDAAGGDTDFYFNSEKDLLQWFRECGGISAATLKELKEHLAENCVSIHEFVNPY